MSPSSGWCSNIETYLSLQLLNNTTYRFIQFTKIIFKKVIVITWTGIAQSVLATALRTGQSGDRIPVGARFSAPVHRPWGPPSLLYNGYRVFPGGKAAGAWRWPPTPSSAEVKERVELYLYSPFGPSWPVLGRALPYFIVLTFRRTCCLQLRDVLVSRAWIKVMTGIETHGLGS